MTKPEASQSATIPPSTPQRDVQRAGSMISLGRWGGIPVSARWSALVVVALFAELLATSALPAAQAGHSAAVYWMVAVLTSCVFALSVLGHELSHALTARHYGVGVRRVTLWLLGGVTEFDGEPSSPRAEAAIAVAGPAASIGIGVAAGALAWWTSMSGLVGVALAWLAVVSIVLGLFNLLPGSPLDGGRLLHAFLWWRYGDRAPASSVTAKVGKILGILLIGLGIAGLLRSSVLGGWTALVGWTIYVGATAEHNAAQALAWRGLTAGQVMTAPAAVLNDWWTVDRALAETEGAAEDAVIALVDFGSGATGVLTAHQLRRVPIDRRADLRLRDLARTRQAEPLLVTESVPVPPVAAGLRSHAGVAVVTRDDSYPIGIITSKTLAGRRGRQADPHSPTPVASQTV